MSIKAAKILDCLAGASGSVSRSDIQQCTNIASATLTRLLKKLTLAGQVTRSDRGYYALSLDFRRKVSLGISGVGGPSDNGVRSNVVYILAQSFMSFSRILWALEESLIRRGFSPVVKTLGKPLAEITETDMKALTDGTGIVIVSVLPLPGRLRQYYASHGVAVVKIGLAEHCEFDSVCWDQRYAYCSMTQRLLDEGFDSIFFVRHESLAQIRAFFQPRFQGFMDAVAAAHIEPRVISMPADFLEPQGTLTRFRSLLDGAEGRVALVFDRTEKTISSLAGFFREWAYVPGHDFALCGVFGNSEAEYFSLMLANMYLGVFEEWKQSAERAVQALCLRMEDATCPPVVILTEAEVLSVKDFDASRLEVHAEQAIG